MIAFGKYVTYEYFNMLKVLVINNLQRLHLIQVNYTELNSLEAHSWLNDKTNSLKTFYLYKSVLNQKNAK